MLNRLVRRFKLWRFFQAPAPVGQHTAPTDDAGRINDGVDYSMPPVLPGYIAALDGIDTQEAYIQESATFSSAQSFRFQFDTPQRGAADMPYMPSPTDPLKEDNWQQRKAKAANFHNTFLYNPLANSAIRYYADMVLGQDGFNLTCRNKDVEEILEDFINNPENSIRERERQFMVSLPLDGELFLRFFKGKDGTTIMLPLRPWDCEYIDTDWDFFKRINFYMFQFLRYHGDNPTAGTEYERKQIPAADIQHVTINTLPYELRGRSMLEPVMPWLRAYKEWLENRARQNHWRTSFIWWVSVAQATASQVAGVLSRWARPPSPGSVVVESDNVKIESPANNLQSSEASEDGRQIKLMIIQHFHLPEYFFADGYNSNLATATAQQLPALTIFESFQTLMVEQVWMPMFKRVIQNAIDAGLLAEEVQEQDADGDPIYEDPPAPNPNDPPKAPPMPMLHPVMQAPPQTGAPADPNAPPMPPVPSGQLMPKMPDPEPQPKRPIKMIDTLEAFEVSYAPVVKEDKLPQAQALVIAEQQGWQSRKKSQIEFGIDPYIEDKQIEREKEAQRMEAAQGLTDPTVNNMMQPSAPGNPDQVPGEGQGAPTTPIKTKV